MFKNQSFPFTLFIDYYFYICYNYIDINIINNIFTEVNMLKRFLLILLSILLILGCCSCNSNNEKETEADTEESTEETALINGVLLSGESRYRIVYAKDTDSALAKKIYNRLKALDKKAISDDYYVLTTDEAIDDNTPEILVGLTNTKAALATYLDFSIDVVDNKIIIFANTEERLSDAIKYFTGKLEKNDSGDVYYPTTEAYVDSYKNYELASLKIGGAEINKYSIIISASANESEKAVANDLQLWLAEKTGVIISVKTDAEETSANEIIIGKTSRPESATFTDELAKSIYYSTTLSGTKVIIFAGNNGSIFAAANEFKSNALAANGELAELEAYNAPNLMNGKKAIFIGNSFIYWGGCVTYITNDTENDPIRAAGGDKGYFNEICKANGVNMDVYNYTYGAHSLDQIYEKTLKNLDKSFLESIDYVFISEAGQNESTFMADFDKVAALFPNAEEIVYLAHEDTFRSNATHIINALPKLAQKGVKIVAWGDLVRDIYTGEVTVPGATLQYNKNSFVKNSSGDMPENAVVTSINGKGDSHHQNPLSGYITAQMCFSAISGSLCEGQKYDFCWDTTIAPQYDLQNFVECQYNNGETTNFVEIFNSPADMLGIQTLMDKYINQYN